MVARPDSDPAFFHTTDEMSSLFVSSVTKSRTGCAIRGGAPSAPWSAYRCRDSPVRRRWARLGRDGRSSACRTAVPRGDRLRDRLAVHRRGHREDGLCGGDAGNPARPVHQPTRDTKNSLGQTVQSEAVNVRDFPNRVLGKKIPYGILTQGE